MRCFTGMRRSIPLLKSSLKQSLTILITTTTGEFKQKQNGCLLQNFGKHPWWKTNYLVQITVSRKLGTYQHFSFTWAFFKLFRLKKVGSNVSVKPSHDLHLHSQYVPILPYSSRSYMQLADTIRDTGVFSWQKSCKRSTNRINWHCGQNESRRAGVVGGR